jgi:hypothetical protein
MAKHTSISIGGAVAIGEAWPLRCQSSHCLARSHTRPGEPGKTIPGTSAEAWIPCTGQCGPHEGLSAMSGGWWVVGGAWCAVGGGRWAVGGAQLGGR